MKRIYLYISIISLIAVVASCNDSYNEDMMSLPETSIVDCEIMTDVPTEYQSSFQSDPEVIILQHLILLDDQYFLNMTEEDALELNIPVSLYNQYVDYVKLMNSAL